METTGTLQRGPLRPGEFAEAAVLGDLALVLEVIGWFAPAGLSGIFHGLAILPFALLAARHRLRAALVAATAAASVGFLVGGLGIVIETALAGMFGLSIGVAFRRGWKATPTIAFTVALAGLPLVVLTDVIYAVSPGFRRLSFDQIRIGWRAALALLRDIGLASLAARMAHLGTPALDWVFAHWWVSVPALELVAVLLVATVCLRMRPFLVEVSRHAVPPLTGTVAERGSSAKAGPPRPVPVRLDAVSYRYPSADEDAVSDVSLEILPGRLLVLAGANGSGKSTLARLLAGRIEPTSGHVARPGPAGLGLVQGTAMVFQRPESQVLGVRVRDDVCWGLPPEQRPDVAAVLERVGLGGFEDRETATLSGGELQRLALAAALARSPQLLISDESTAMVDRDGRRTIVGLLRQLASSGIAVVHITHRMEEADTADEVLFLSSGRLSPVDAVSMAPPANGSVPSGPQLSPKPIVRSLKARLDRLERTFEPVPSPATGVGVPTRPGGAAAVSTATLAPLVELRDVGYEYATGTPWAHQALQHIDLEIRRGEGVVVTGPNGSGKSTLAWLLAGLTVPTSGEALIGGEPIGDQPGRTALAFQHARLQLLRPTVLADVALAGDEQLARRALADVGLDPDEFGARRVDELSGGEQRRVALAGLLVGEPELIVLDEPFAGLDDDARRALAGVLRALRSTRGVAVVVVSHDLDNAELLGERLIRLEGGTIASEASLVEHE